MIDPKLLKILLKYGNEITYQNDEIVIYSGHTPKVGFVLLEGKVEIQMSRSKKILPPQSIFGLKELMNNEAYKHSIKVYSGSKIISLDKSAVKAISKYKAAQDLLTTFCKEAS